ncbi:MAG: 4Fe-4S binding protein [Armatimonadia bacterium]
MVDLSVQCCGLELRNPIVAAAAGITETADRLKRCEDAGCGAAIIKSYFQYEPARHSPTPRFRVIRDGLGRDKSFCLYSFEQANVYGLDEFAEQIRRAKEMCEIPIIASLNCNTEERWNEGAKLVEQAGADAIELNVSCPHGTHIMSHADMMAEMTRALRAVKDAVAIPAIPKMSPQLSQPGAVANALAEAGADAVTMFNRFTGLDIDLETELPIMHGGYAGHGGPWSIHYVLRWISDVSPTLPVPILASGGVSDGADVAKLILAGSTLVQTCTAIVMQGYSVVGKLLSGLAEFMDRKGYERLEDFRGNVCGRVKGNDEIDRIKRQVADIESSKCIKCGLCARVCIYDAPVEGTKAYEIPEQACDGCGLCQQLCPTGAIVMKDLAEPRGFELGVK